MYLSIKVKITKYKILFKLTKEMKSQNCHPVKSGFIPKIERQNTAAPTSCIIINTRHPWHIAKPAFLVSKVQH